MPFLDIGLLVTGVNNATAPLKSVGHDLDDLGEHVKKVGENSQATAERLKAIEVVIGGILIEKSIELTKKFIEMASAVQDTDIRMAAWAGGVEEADKIIGRFASKIGAAGIPMETLGQAFVKLRAAGVGVEEAEKTVTNLVNGIAAVGGKDLAGKLEAAATSFQRFAAKGVVSTRELNAIVNSTGLTVGELAKSANMNITQFYDALKDKTLGASQLLTAFNKAAHDKFGDFASLLDNTISGSISKFKVDMDLAFGSLGGTGMNVQIVAFIQNLDKAINGFIQNLKPEEVAAFFQVFRDAAPVLGEVFELIVNVAKALVTAADVAFRVAGMLPPEMVEFGILGYIVGGKKGAALLAMIGYVISQLKVAGNQINAIATGYDKVAAASGKGYQGVLDALNKADPDHPIVNMFKAIGGWATSSAHQMDETLLPSLKKLGAQAEDIFKGVTDKNANSNSITKLFGTPEQLKAIQDALDKLAHTKVGGEGLTDPPNNTALKAKLDALRQETENLIGKTSGEDALLRMKTAGDQLGITIQGITNQTRQWNAALELAATKIADSKLPMAEKVKIEKQLGDLQVQINVDTAAAIEHARILNALKQKQLDTELAIQRATFQEVGRQLELQTRAQNSPRFSAISGTSGGALSLQIDKERVKYAEEILRYHDQIDKLEEKAASDTANAAKYKALEADIQGLIGQTEKFAANLSATTALQTEFFKSLGQTMENDLSNGISGLIKGTMSWGDVGRQVFGSLIDMSVKYLIQLAEIRLFESAMNAAAPGSGGLMSLLGFANGGIPGLDGGKLVTPFANGGLTQGPTLFGLAGEAGTEAIMPITRVGGKLGVHASGAGGGNHYHITVNAVDTQTGLQFVAKHIDHIDAGLRQRQTLNKR